MDPLSVLALASGALQLLESTAKICKKGREVFKTGTTEDIEHIDFIARDMSSVCLEFKRASTRNVNASLRQRSDVTAVEEQQVAERAGAELQLDLTRQGSPALEDLARRAEEAAEDFVSLLKHLNVKDAGDASEPAKKKRRTIQVAKRALKITWNEKKIEDLHTRVRDMQQALTLRLVAVQRLVTGVVYPAGWV